MNEDDEQDYDLHPYYEEKRKNDEEMVFYLCWMFIAFVVVAVGVAVVNWIISLFV